MFGSDGMTSLDANLGSRLVARPFSSWDDTAVLAAVLGGAGARDAAAALLSRRGGLAGLARAGRATLEASHGIGPARAERVLAAFELGRRSIAPDLNARMPLRSSRDLVARFTARLAGSPVERIAAIALDARHRPLAELELALGGVASCSIDASDVFRALLLEGARSGIVVHNHPSGDPSPSGADIAFTRDLVRAGQAIGLPLLDHLIVARNGWFSFADRGWVDDVPTGLEGGER